MREEMHQVQAHAHAHRGAGAVGLDVSPGRGAGHVFIARHPDGAKLGQALAEFGGFHVIRVLSDAAVEVGVMAIDDGVELTLVDRNVEPFDVTRAPEVDIDAPIAQRTPGGLGLHLIRRMADSVEYEYKTESRRSLTTVRMTSAGMAVRSRTTGNGGGDVRN